MLPTRLLNLAGFAAPVIYFATVLAGGWATPGYSHLHRPVSALFESGAPHATTVSVAFIIYNLLLMAFGSGLLQQGERTGFPRLAAMMILLNGAFGLMIELTPMDPVGAPSTVAGTLHLVIAGFLVLTCAAAMSSLAIVWRHNQALRGLATITLLLLAVMLVSGAVAAAAAALDWPYLGLAQRVTIGSYLAWILALTVATRGAQQTRGKTNRL